MNRTWKQDIKTAIPAMRIVEADATLGASGAISSQVNRGLKLTKTAAKTGRYTCQLVDHLGAAVNAYALLSVEVTLIGADDAAYTAAKGQWLGLIRADDVGGNNNDGTFEIQLQRPDTQADAEAIDNAKIRVVATLRDSSLTY